MIRKLLLRIILLVLLGGSVLYVYIAVKNRQININNWFVGGQTMGVDISSYQEGVDFNELKNQGVEFAYIKATEGSSHIDSSFEEKWESAQEAGLLAGAYHYFSYGSSGASQAENFISVVGDLGGGLIPAIDMELTVEEVYNPPEKEDVVKGLKAFVAVVEEEYGVKPLIYAQKDYYDKYLAEDFSDYPRWVRNVFYPVWFDVGDDWAVWQYNDRGILSGYSGEKYIDLNIVKDIESLKQ